MKTTTVSTAQQEFFESVRLALLSLGDLLNQVAAIGVWRVADLSG